jgi:signal transduction histidine kinase
LAEDLHRFREARKSQADRQASARTDYFPLGNFDPNSTPAELNEWLGLGGVLTLPLFGPQSQERGWVALVYSSADPASDFDRKLLESAAEIVSLMLERRRQEEIDRLNEELFSQNRRILEASRMKTEFMAKMSHELRTPLNAIIGFSQLLLDQKTGPLSPKQFEFLNDVLQSGMHLLRIINDLLDLAKIEAGKVEARLEPVSVVEFAAEVRDLLRPLASQKRIAVEVNPGLDPPEAMLDAQRFRQILYNLISNAIKFTPEGGESVALFFRWHESTLEAEVRDRGIGIRPEDIPKLFKPFQQLENALPASIPGSGLGLAICQQLAALHRGRIEVRSEPNRGSSFIVFFPEAAVPVSPEP